MGHGKQQGFTLIEMIVVIVLLGLLAAAALPRFSSIDTAAHKSAVTGTASSFRTAVLLVHVTYFAKGYRGAVDNVVGFGNNLVDVNTAGYPTDTSNSNTITGTATCQRVWNGIMDNPPTTPPPVPRSITE